MFRPQDGRRQALYKNTNEIQLIQKGNVTRQVLGVKL
jgi:hypothetical protein